MRAFSSKLGLLISYPCSGGVKNVMDKPPPPGSYKFVPSQWIKSLPLFPRQPAIATLNEGQPLGHPSPQGQVISRPRASNGGASTSRASTHSRASNTRAAARKASAAKKTFECKECGKKCKDQWTLNDHMPKHSDEQKFACDDCGGRFKRKKDLNSHTNKTCPSTSQADAALPSQQRRNTRSEPGGAPFVIMTPELYKKGTQSRIEADLESESVNKAMILSGGGPLPFDSFVSLSDPRYEPSCTPQQTLSELEDVLDGRVGPDVMRVLSDPKITRTIHELSEREPINHQNEVTHTPYSTIVGTLSMGPNSRCEAGSDFQFAMPSPSSSGGVGSANDVGVPPLDNSTESESLPPSSLNTSIPHTSRRLSLRNSTSVQGLQVYDQSSSADCLSSPLSLDSASSQGYTTMTNDTRNLGNTDGGIGLFMAEDNRNDTVAVEDEWNRILSRVEDEWGF